LPQIHNIKKRIIEFYGETCPDCFAFSPEVEKLEQEGKVEFERLEVWNNQENSQRMMSLRDLYIKECNGNMAVPSFYDPNSNRLICEPRSGEEFKAWIFEK
jgi:glutaredoxin-related protein